jgi:phosphotransferase system enzyme I (PtsI)
MRELKGVTAATGITKGIVCIYETDVESMIPHYEISEMHVPKEIERVREALRLAHEEMQAVTLHAETLFDKQTAEIFKVHLLIISNASICEKIENDIRTRRVNAEHAVQDVFGSYSAAFKDQKEHFAELAHDYLDIRDRILAKLNVNTGGFSCPVGERGAVVVVAKKLTPSLVVNVPPKNVLAFVTEEGGLTSHATILARSYGVPVLFGVAIDETITCGVTVIVDGSQAKFIVDPDEKTCAYYAKKIEKIEAKKHVCAVNKQRTVQTKTGQRIVLKVNVSTPQELLLIEGMPIDGVGLLRTEFLFMQRDTAPTEEEQYEMYKKILSEYKDLPVTIRVLDIGEDKIPPYITIARDMNLDLTLRGALAVEAFKPLFVTQMKALLRANQFGNLRILYPMVSDLSDLATYRGIVKEAKKELQKDNVKIKRMPFKEGVMIETPGGVLLAEEIVREVDFINIGSNDLLQYTLAAARGNALVESRYHILHPALVKGIELIVKAAKKKQIEVCLCGEVASFEEFYPLLLQLGLQSFSVSVGKFDDIKCELLHLNKKAGKDIVSDYYATRSKKGADKYFSQFL